MNVGDLTLLDICYMMVWSGAASAPLLAACG